MGMIERKEKDAPCLLGFDSSNAIRLLSYFRNGHIEK